jgi:cytochrome c oxidase subunit IV
MVNNDSHVPHVLPVRTYLTTYALLVVLTAVTVAASYGHFGRGNLVIALGIATAKAVAVAAIFMHLWYDHRFHAIIFASALVFLAIFVGFTMIDTENRGRTDAALGEKPADITNPFGGTRSEAAWKALHGAPSAVPPAGSR